MIPVRRHLWLVAAGLDGIVLALVFLLLLPLGAAAQPLSTADLADTWRVTYLAVPTGPFTASSGKSPVVRQRNRSTHPE